MPRRALAAATRSATQFAWPVRVYFEDTDAGGVVYYANYLRFMERARTEWLRQRGFEQDQLRADAGVLFVVRAVQLDLLRPARFNDALSVTCGLSGLGRASLDVRQQVCRGESVLATASVRLACVDAERFTPTAIPPPVRAAVESDLGDEA